MLVEVALESISPWVSWSGFFSRAGRHWKVIGSKPSKSGFTVSIWAWHYRFLSAWRDDTACISGLRRAVAEPSTPCPHQSPLSPLFRQHHATPCNTTFILVWRHIFCSCPICFCLMPHLCFFVSSLLLLEPPIFAKMCVSYHFLVISPSKSVYGQERKIMSSHSKTA